APAAAPPSASAPRPLLPSPLVRPPPCRMRAPRKPPRQGGRPVTTQELRRLTLELAADVRARRYVPDMDLGKSEYLGAQRDLAAAYDERAGPLLDVYLQRGFATGAEI